MFVDRVQCVQTLSSHDDTVESLTVDSQNLFSASWDHTIRVWDLDTLDCKGTLKCNSDVRELVINDRKLYSGCGNGTIQVNKEKKGGF